MAISIPRSLGVLPLGACLKPAFFSLAAVAAFVGAPLAASAQVTIKFPTVVPADNTVPDGPAPWLTAVINNTIFTDVVSITLTPSFVNPAGVDNFISQVVFKLNYDVLADGILPAFSRATSPPDSTNARQFVSGAYPSSGDCTFTGSFFCGFVADGREDVPTALSGENSVSLTGGGVPNVGDFDLKLDLPPPPGEGTGATLAQGDTATFYLKGAGLTAQAFNVERNDQGWTACAKVQGISTGTGSSVICDGVHIPKVPGPLPLLGAAAAFGYSRRIRSRIQGSRQQASIS